MNNNSRTRNSVRNISYGLVVTVLNTLVSFISRTVLVKTLGTEVLGLNGLFTEVISMLSLAELGVGMAIIYSLYKPISENDHKKISQLMGLYRTSYNAIAIITLLLGLAITPFVDKLITDIEYSLSYIRLIFFLFVIKTSTSYLFSYKTSLLNADQKQYIVSLTTVLLKLAFVSLMVVVLVLTKNYIIYLIIQIVQSVITNIALSHYVDKNYPYINYKEELPKIEKKEIFSNIKNIFVKRVSGMITSSTDNILISSLVSTIQVGLYSNYVMIFTVIRTLKQQFTNGIAASIGNLSVTENPQHCMCILNRLTYIYYIFAIVMSSGLMAVIKEFITIWLGKEYIMPDLVIYISIFNLFLEICSDPLWQYLEVSGLFRQDKNIAILGSTINLLVSIILGIKIGIAGIFIGTLCTQLIQLILKTILIFKEKFLSSPLRYNYMISKMFISYVLLIIVQKTLIEKMIFENLYVGFLVKGLVSVVVAFVLSLIFFIKSDELSYVVTNANKLLKLNKVRAGK